MESLLQHQYGLCAEEGTIYKPNSLDLMAVNDLITFLNNDFPGLEIGGEVACFQLLQIKQNEGVQFC